MGIYWERGRDGGGGGFMKERGRGDREEKGEERFEREFLLLVESSWARGPLVHNEFNEQQKQLTN